MYCPYCGSELEEIKSSGEKREENKCTKKEYPCFSEDYPLYFHHPFMGIDSRPGDSWSLSWV